MHIFNSLSDNDFMVKTVNHHASIVIVYSDKDLYFFNGYDFIYRVSEFKGMLNPLGGSHNFEDKNPILLLEREVNEELSDPDNELANFSKEEASLLKEEIYRNCSPCQDFYSLHPFVEADKNRSKEERRAIVSLYDSKIPLELMIMLKIALEKGGRITSEGDGGSVVSLDDMLSGKRLLAWGNPLIMGYYLNRKDIPNPCPGVIEPIGLPRENFKSYLKDFRYLEPVYGQKT